VNWPKLKVWVEVSSRVNGYFEELVDLPDDWNQRSDEDQREYAVESWEEFRDNIANGGFALIHETGEMEDF
jgi:hypothetical protein